MSSAQKKPQRLQLQFSVESYCCLKRLCDVSLAHIRSRRRRRSRLSVATVTLQCHVIAARSRRTFPPPVLRQLRAKLPNLLRWSPALNPMPAEALIRNQSCPLDESSETPSEWLSAGKLSLISVQRTSVTEPLGCRRKLEKHLRHDVSVTDKADLFLGGSLDVCLWRVLVWPHISFQRIFYFFFQSSIGIIS